MPRRKQKFKSRNPEIRIYGVPDKLHREVNNISNNLGVTVSDFLKPRIGEIVQSFPKEMRERVDIY